MKSSNFLIVFFWKKYIRKMIHVYNHILYTNLILCRQKWKKFGFWKDEAPNEVRIFLQKHMFLRWNFVSNRFRNFSVTFVNICNVSESRFDIEACARKKLWLYDILNLTSGQIKRGGGTLFSRKNMICTMGEMRNYHFPNSTDHEFTKGKASSPA